MQQSVYSIQGTTDWMRYELTLDVPAENDGQILDIGLTLHGKGQVWVRDTHLKIVETLP